MVDALSVACSEDDNLMLVVVVPFSDLFRPFFVLQFSSK
jgi:hypothetical protein